MEKKPNKKLLPVTFISGRYGYYQKNTFQEHLLLKALRITSDPQKIKQMIGARTVAEVARVYDKISSRKEYNKALQKLGMDFDWLAKGLKVEAETAEKSADRIKALQIVLKSLGMDAYEDTPQGGGSWEDLILKASEAKPEQIAAPVVIDADYEVVRPETPEHMKKMRDKEDEQGGNLYK